MRHVKYFTYSLNHKLKIFSTRITSTRILSTRRLLGLMTLEEKRNRSDLIEMFKISIKLSPAPFKDFFELHSERRIRGHSFKLKNLRFNTDLRKFFFSQHVINRWNELEETA